MTMTLQATFSDVKIDSIVLHILNEYNFTPLTILFTDYLKKKHSKKRFMLINFLLKAYAINNFYNDTFFYIMIKKYIYSYPNNLLKTYLWY